LIAWLTAAALACDPLDVDLAAARHSVDDAELDDARRSLQAAYDGLGCQSAPVPTADLLALYRLDAAVAFAQEDEKAALYAVLRAVAADHVDGMSADVDGPDLAALYHIWAARLAETLVTVSVQGGGTVWVDGRAATDGQPVHVAQGEHLIQVQTASSLDSQVVELSADRAFATGSPLVPAPVPLPVPTPVPLPPPLPAPIAATRHHLDVPSTVGWISGLAVGAAGGALLGWAWLQEQAFLGDSYVDATYGGCARGAPCYAPARTDAIRADTERIRTAYVAGYSLAGSGGLLFTGGAFGAAIRARPAVTVAGRF
jgi:hypothetical protein